MPSPSWAYVTASFEAPFWNLQVELHLPNGEVDDLEIPIEYETIPSEDITREQASERVIDYLRELVLPGLPRKDFTVEFVDAMFRDEPFID